VLLNHIGDSFAQVNQARLAAMNLKKAKESGRRAQFVRQAASSLERFNKDSHLRQAEETKAAKQIKSLNRLSKKE